MPVAPVLRATALGRPRDDVPDPRWDLLVASGAAVGLGGPGCGPYDPLAVGPFLGPLGTAERALPGFPWHVACAAILSRTHAAQGKGCVGHARQRIVIPAVRNFSSSGAGAKAGSRYSV